ncbi:transcription regulator merr dna binding [Trichococcus palustris]|jgi:MerR family transcriptional regulator, aldehyde-responsive regulator|uniref:Transcription regulator merr dna binding n=1 Tax=Trichococcus palustris TaxID=140314 RepID=A0A143YTG0_9LACT|nr:MerR family transcriptional regulator [Trichococcus palustris]CZQ98162.1 transcription regulator merr dna binding [Trichococcus palustris]SFK95402.1 DNA-binding transcriptional regulator, MerR family [Trichococcus palustris]
MNIAEVSKKFSISPDTLRYYERIGLLPYVKRNESGYREYDDEACEWIYFTLVMRSAGISVEALKTYISLFQQGKNTIAERKQILLEQRRLLAERISELQSVLERLDNKIDGYEERVLKYEDKLFQNRNQYENDASLSSQNI